MPPAEVLIVAIVVVVALVSLWVTLFRLAMREPNDGNSFSRDEL